MLSTIKVHGFLMIFLRLARSYDKFKENTIVRHTDSFDGVWLSEYHKP